jgi:hypothetical protein
MTDELIFRLGMDEASRELDCALGVALDGFVVDGERYGLPRYCRRNETGGLDCPGQNGDDMVPRYSSSLDAAAALAERATPGKFWWLFSRAMHAVTSARLGAVASVQPGELGRAFLVEVLKEAERMKQKAAP